MTIAELCLFASVVLYLLTIAPVRWISAGPHDESTGQQPNGATSYEGGLRERALGAHQSGIEAFPFFAAAVLLAEFRAAPQNLINELSVLFLIVRTAHVLTYVGDRPSLRAILWGLGFLISVAIFFLPLLRNYLPL